MIEMSCVSAGVYEGPTRENGAKHLVSSVFGVSKLELCDGTTDVL